MTFEYDLHTVDVSVQMPNIEVKGHLVQKTQTSNLFL